MVGGLALHIYKLLAQALAHVGRLVQNGGLLFHVANCIFIIKRPI